MNNVYLRNWAGCARKHLVFLVLGVVALGVAVNSLLGLIRFQEANARALTVTGTICDVVEDTDSEGDLVYRIMVSYQHNGSTYRQQYDSVYSKNSAGKVGQTVTFRIDAQNPGELIDNNREEDLVGFYGGLLGFGMFAFPVLVRMYDIREVGEGYTYGEILGITAENIQKDLMRKAGGRGFCVGFTGLGIVLLVSALLLPDAMGAAAVIAGGLALALGVFFGLRYYGKCKKIRNGEYRVSTATVRSRKIEPDSDGPDAHYLYCAEGQRHWRTRVEKKRYNTVRDGQIVRCVFFERDREPVITYWNTGAWAEQNP